MMGLSPAGSALMSSSGYGLGTALSQQVTQQTDEEKKRREQELAALRAGMSPAGQALAGAKMNLTPF